MDDFYPFDAYTRVAVRSTIGNLHAPTVAELEAATDVGRDITPDGLDIQRRDNIAERTYWKGRQTGAVPSRWSTSVSLTGYRRTSGGVLFPLAVFGARTVLVARYGMPCDEPWAAGQSVDVVVGRWGKRSTARSARNTAVTFGVSLVVRMDDDDATVVA